MAILGRNAGVLGEPGAALADGWFLKAECGEPGLGVEESASNGGVWDFLWFGGWQVESG